MAIIYEFPKIYNVDEVMLLRSHPIKSGAFKAAQSAK